MTNGGKKTAFGRLSIMMLLQYAVWGIWLPYIANYLGAPIDEGGLGFTGTQIGWILGLAASIGAVTAPFLAGQIADRYLSAEIYLGLLVIAGGLVKYRTAAATEYNEFLLLAIAYSILYMPTLALTNSIAFSHLKNPDTQFPRVRVWGTIGWIASSNAFPLIWLQQDLQFTWLPPFLEGTERPDATLRLADCLRASGIISVAYGVFAIVLLPKTRPMRSADHPLAFLRALGMLRHPGFLVVTLVALPISMIHQVYFIRTGPFLESVGFAKQYVGPIMSIGQFSEICFLAVLGWFIAKLGYRWTLALGGFAYVARFAIFAMADAHSQNVVMASMVLHGLCYGCFFAGAYIYVDRVSPIDIRHSAQTVFGIIILGVGPILAGFYNGYFDTFQTESGAQSYEELWWAQSLIALIATAALLLLFRPGVSTLGAEAEVAEAEAASAENPM